MYIKMKLHLYRQSTHLNRWQQVDRVRSHRSRTSIMILNEHLKIWIWIWSSKG